jgi:tryptophan synthase alpha chain
LPNTSPNDSRIAEKFRELRSREEGALIAYLMGGDPEPKSFLANCASLIEGGADIVEIGIPFSDPIADGPVIQASSMRALSHGATPSGILAAIREISSQFETPIVVLTYFNPILAMGTERFLKRACESGISGIIVPDLPIEEGGDFGNLASKHGIDSIRLAAPNTSSTRLRIVLDQTKGFVYLVSLYGVTGPRDSLGPQALETVKAVKLIARDRIPLAAGFGITRPEHVSSLLKAGADGAIVGSALVRIVNQHVEDSSSAENDIKSTVKALKQATTRS